jgi:hypothetical protein
MSYSPFSLISEELHDLAHYLDLLFILVGGLRSRNRRRRLPPRPSRCGQPRPDHRVPFLHDIEFRGVPLKLTEQAVLHLVTTSDQVPSLNTSALPPLAVSLLR